MFESKFRKISEQYNAEYKKTEHKVSSTLGSKMPITIHNFKLTHNNSAINIVYEFGNSNVAEINLEISNKTKIPNFEVRTREQLSRLFSFNKNPWKIKSNNIIISKKLNELLNQSGLTEIAKNKTFEPTIIGNNLNGLYKLNTIFYLGFDDKEDSLVPIIDFHKSFIEFINDNY